MFPAVFWGYSSFNCQVFGPCKHGILLRVVGKLTRVGWNTCARACVCVCRTGSPVSSLSTADGFFLLQYVNYQDTNWDVSDGKKQAGDTTEDKSDNVALFTSANVELTPVQVTGTDGKYAAVAGWSGAAYQQIKMDGRSFYRSKGRQLARWSVSRARRRWRSSPTSTRATHRTMPTCVRATVLGCDLDVI